jgi:hypothetical protein
MRLRAIGMVLVVVAALGCAPCALAGTNKGVPIRIKSGTVTITFSSKAWSTLDSLSTTLGERTSAIAPAKETAPGSFVLPISNGTLNSVTAQGTLGAKGGLRTEDHVALPGGLLESTSSATATGPAISIAASGAKLSMRSPNADPPLLSIFKLSLGHAKVLSTSHSVTVSKIGALVTAAGAPFFLSGSIKAGQEIATVTIRAKD